MIKYIVGLAIAAVISIVLRELGTPEFLNGWISCMGFVFTVASYTTDIKFK